MQSVKTNSAPDLAADAAISGAPTRRETVTEALPPSSGARPIGIVAALHDEIATLLDDMGPDVITHRIGQRDYHVGSLDGCACVVVLARIGKVAAAATTVTLIREFNVHAVVFTGLAGGIGQNVAVGDVVVAQSLLQHDMDASPLFARYEIPLLSRSQFDADAALTGLLVESAEEYISHSLPSDISAAARDTFALNAPTIHQGLIISGDRFINDARHVKALQETLPAALCVEMEGAAVAQVCHEYDVPFAVMRTISDRADGGASIDFSAFLREVARLYSAGILRRFLAAHQAKAAL